MTDKGYDYDRYREDLLLRSNPPVPVHPDLRHYKARNRIKGLFGKLRLEVRARALVGRRPLQYSAIAMAEIIIVWLGPAISPEPRRSTQALPKQISHPFATLNKIHVRCCYALPDGLPDGRGRGLPDGRGRALRDVLKGM